MSLTGFQNPTRWFMNWIYSSFGWEDYYDREKSVSATQALSYAPIWYGVTKIAGHISQLPINVYERVEGGGEKKRDHPTARLLRKPNTYQTHTVFFEQAAMHSLIEGNGRAAIVKAGGRVTELLPLHPGVTATAMVEGVKYHATRPAEDDRLREFFPDTMGERGYGKNTMIVLEDSEVVHVPGLSYDGIVGLPLREIAKRNLGAAINQEKRINKQAEQGFSGSLLIEAPPGMFRKQEDAEEFLNYFESRHNSPEKAGRSGLLREGMKANLIQSTNRESEMIDNRRFARQDAALWLGLEQILGDDSSVSYNSLEQKNLGYLQNCLNRWLKRWEEELECKILPRRQFDRDTHYIRFNTAALLKSDYKTSIEALAMGITSTIISPNEAREKLDMLPYDGGDVHQNPAITPGEEPAEPEPEPNEPDETPAASRQTEAATRSRIVVLLKAECRKLLQLANKDNFDAVKFSDAVENYYWSFLPKLADVCEECGIDRDAASEYCGESKDRLVEMLHSGGDFRVKLKQQVVHWPNRVESILHREPANV